MKHLSMAVVVRNGKVLVQERQKAAKGVVVEFPGGEVLENETGTDASVRKLYEETHLEGLNHVATFAGINDFGGRIYYAVFRASEQVKPKVVDSERRQAFKWLKPDELPLDEFHTADVDFINTKLGKYCVSDA